MDCREHLDILLDLAQDMGYEIIQTDKASEPCVPNKHFTKVLVVNTSTGMKRRTELVCDQLVGDHQFALYELNEQQEMALRITTQRAA